MGLVSSAWAQTIGIVLMHGKTGSPNTVISIAGCGIWSTPERCWSQRRIYDRPFLDCLTEIDSAIGRLKGRDASRIVVAGMSQGGDAALAYGASMPIWPGSSRLLRRRRQSGRSGSLTSRKASLRPARWSPLAAATKPPVLSIATSTARFR